MEADNIDYSFPDMKELENKIGMKTPETLSIWMRDAPKASDYCLDRKENVAKLAVGDSFDDKIKHLKFEMGCLRAADIRILRQLVAVHEGMEAVRWLLEERGGALASHSSSMTGSQCSLTEASPGTSSPTGEDPSLTPARLQIQDPAEPGKETEQGRDRTFSRRSYFDMLTDSVKRAQSGSTMGAPSTGGTNRLSVGASGQTGSRASPSTCTTSPTRAKQLGQHGTLPEATPPPPHNCKTRFELMSTACPKEDTGKGTICPPVETATWTTLGASGRNLEDEEEQSMPSSEEEQSMPSSELLFGYDAQWSWVESQDDVTFL